jgi:hypothetical protein
MSSYIFHNLEDKLTLVSIAHYTVVVIKLTFFAGVEHELRS